MPSAFPGGVDWRIEGVWLLDQRENSERQMGRLYPSMMAKMDGHLPKFGDAGAPLEEV